MLMTSLLSPLRRWTRRPSPIGLDVGAHTVKAAQLMRGPDDRWMLLASAVFPRGVLSSGSASAAEARRIGDVLFRRGFSGEQIVIAVPDEKLMTANLELPPRSADIPLDAIARAEFGRSLQVESEGFEFAYWDLPAPARAAKSTHVMGVGCRHADSQPLIDSFAAVDLELSAVDVEACALTRALFSMSASPREITAIVDIGWRAVRLFVVHQGVVSYQRSLAGFGLERLFNLFQDLLDVRGEAVIEQVLRGVTLLAKGEQRRSEQSGQEEARRILHSHFDAVANEIVTSFSYTAHQYPDVPVRRVLLCGGGAGLNGLADYFTSCLQVQTIAVRAGDLVQTPDQARAAVPTLTMAIGLAQFAAEDES